MFAIWPQIKKRVHGKIGIELTEKSGVGILIRRLNRRIQKYSKSENPSPIHVSAKPVAKQTPEQSIYPALPSSKSQSSPTPIALGGVCQSCSLQDF